MNDTFDTFLLALYRSSSDAPILLSLHFLDSSQGGAKHALVAMELLIHRDNFQVVPIVDCHGLVIPSEGEDFSLNI